MVLLIRAPLQALRALATRPRRILLFAIPSTAVLAIFALLACDSGTGPAADEALSCPDLSSRYFRDSIGDGHYRIIAPNGGKAYHTGDSLKVIATSGADDSEAVLELAVFRGGKSTFVPVPGTPRTSIDLRNRCQWSFRIPDSLSAAGKKISLVSDSIKIRVARYGQEGFVFDYSDAFFRIDSLPDKAGNP